MASRSIRVAFRTDALNDELEVHDIDVAEGTEDAPRILENPHVDFPGRWVLAGGDATTGLDLRARPRGGGHERHRRDLSAGSILARGVADFCAVLERFRADPRSVAARAPDRAGRARVRAAVERAGSLSDAASISSRGTTLTRARPSGAPSDCSCASSRCQPSTVV